MPAAMQGQSRVVHIDAATRNQTCLVPLPLKQLSLDARHTQTTARDIALKSISSASGAWGNQLLCLLPIRQGLRPRQTAPAAD